MMDHMFVLALFLVIDLICLTLANVLNVNKFPLLMPNVHPDVDELYLCTPVRILPGKTFYIVGFEPNATMKTAHHMLLYGCSIPGSEDHYWDCGEMAQVKSNNILTRASPCKESSNLVAEFSNGMDALNLNITAGIGYALNPRNDGDYENSNFMHGGGVLLLTKSCLRANEVKVQHSLLFENVWIEGKLRVIYAWARDATTLELPEDVGFQVGVGSHIQYLVLQVHYAHTERFKDGSTDDSGIVVMYTSTPKSKLAGVVLLGTGGAIPPMSTTHMETDCTIAEKKTIYPFAYRTHTHSLGKVVSGYSVHSDKNNVDNWHLLGKRDPLTPQMFYPISNQQPITFGDRLAARCTMESNRQVYTHIGPTNKDEMCNFYLMYYVKEGTPLEMKYCFSLGPPYFYWDNPQNNLNHIPDIEASSV